MPGRRWMKELMDRGTGRPYYPSDHLGDYDRLEGGGAEGIEGLWEKEGKEDRKEGEGAIGFKEEGSRSKL